MADFEHIAFGIGLIFHQDLEGVIGGSERTNGLVATERPYVFKSKKPFSVIEVKDEQIPEGTVAYSAGRPLKAEGTYYMPLTFYRRIEEDKKATNM
jgi:hypothetical protein